MYDKSTSLMKRVLSLIASIETSMKAPLCFARVAGDFDGAGISFGIFQWNIGQNTLQPLLKQFFTRHESIAKNIFGLKFDEFKGLLAKSLAEQLDWAKKIQSKNKLLPPYDSLFKNLGLTKEFQDIQIESAKFYFDRGVKMANEYGLKSEVGIALMVDIAVQNGSINSATKNLILKEIEQKGFKDNEKEKMRIIANRRAEAANPKWIEDVRKRKLMFVEGGGAIHGINYKLSEEYAIDSSVANVNNSVV